MIGDVQRARNTFAPANLLENPMPSFLPRLGLAGIGGLSQMTPAAVSTMQRAMRGGGGGGAKKKRRSGSKKKAAGAGGKRKRSKKSSGRKVLKKGSAAAKAYMAKIRKMRKK